MARVHKDMTGQKFGRWTLIERHESSTPKGIRYLCECECGNERVVGACELRRGKSKSCGCLREELKVKHGGFGTGEWNTWMSMKQRCYNTKDNAYKNYGGRGILMCNRWLESFSDFVNDMGKRPDNHSIERVDNDKGYSPDNCVWATRKQQSRNTRASHFITVNGETKVLQDWANDLGTKHTAILHRLNRGWSEIDAVTISPQRRVTPYKSRDVVMELNGKKQTVYNWSKELGISASIIKARLDRGWSDKDALTVPPQDKSHKWITFNGIRDTVTGWSKRMGWSAETLRVRLKKGWSIERALNTPVGSTP